MANPFRLLKNGTDKRLLEDGTSLRIVEDGLFDPTGGGLGIIDAVGRCVAVGILMVGLATPVKAMPVVAGATLTVTGGGPSTFDMGTGLSRSNGIAKPATIKTKHVASPSAATARLPGAFLGGKVALASTSRSHGLAAPATFKLLIAGGTSKSTPRTTATLNVRTPFAGASVSEGRLFSGFLGGKVALTGQARSNGLVIAQLSTHFPTTQIGTGLSLANARALSSLPKSLLLPAPARASELLRGSLTIVRYTTPVRASGLVSGRIGANTSIGTGLSRHTTRLRASLNLITYATPIRDVAKAGPATVRFVGAGFDMGLGISRADSRLRATGIRLISYATPVRSGTLRMWGPPSLWYSSQPIAASGRAWAAGPLGMVGQQYLPDYSRASGGRVFSVHIRLMSAVSPVEAHPVAKAGLQFAGGPKVQVAGLSRSTSLANGQQLQVTQTNRVGLDGKSRTNGVLTGAFLKQYYHVTPSKLDPLVTGWLHTHHEVAPVRHAGVVAPATLTASLKQNITGTTRQTSRLPGAFLKIKPQLQGVIISDSRLLAAQPNHKLVLQLAPSRGTTRASCAALQFTGGSTITLGPAPVRATSRLQAAIAVLYGTMPSRASGRLRAQITSKQVLVGTLRSTARVFGPLGVTAPSIIGLEGRIRSTQRLIGFSKTINAGGRILSGSGRLVGSTLTQAIALPGKSLLHPRAVAVLAFTGAVVQPVSGRLLGDSRALATLKTIYRASPIRSQARTIGTVRTIIPLRGVTLEQALLTGEFSNPYELATSLNTCRVSCAFLRSSSPLAGRSRATGSLVANLTIHGQVAARIFFAKNRVFVWLAHDRDFVIDAKDRRFIFYAGGLA